jgi:CRISPR-associated protein Cas6
MPIIDLSFVLVGTTFPLDHGFCLFSAICHVVPGLHGDRRIGVHPIRGRQIAPGVLTLDDRSRLKLRLPSEEISPYIALAGEALELEGHRLQVGIPSVQSLIPAANLASRLVTFRHALTPSDLEEDVRRELGRLEVSGTPQFVHSSRPPFTGQALRRVLKVREKRVVGYSLRMTGLTAEESIRVQEEGLGGRRRMGCGVFAPWRGS